jgi:hypothetical protein
MIQEIGYFVQAQPVNPQTKETGMEQEARDGLEIIAAGIELEELDGPEYICCWGAFAPFRM